MAHKVFFSLKYKSDAYRAEMIRDGWVRQGNKAAGFVDSAEFEKIKAQGDEAIKLWIDTQLSETSVTVVLVGADTCVSRWVNYTVLKSKKMGKGLLGIDISMIKDSGGKQSSCCGRFPTGYPFYRWFNDNGYNNLGEWVEQAAEESGRDD